MNNTAESPSKWEVARISLELGPFKRLGRYRRKTAESPPQRKVKRIGVVLGPFNKLNVSALQFLVLHMNSLQHWFEYEFLPSAEHLQDAPPFMIIKGHLVDQPKGRDIDWENEKLQDFLKKFSRDTPVNREDIVRKASTFMGSYKGYLQKVNDSYGLKEPPPEHFVLVTEARFTDKYYLTHSPQVSIMALGNWERSMAPPSILEFILTLIIRDSVAVVCPPLGEAIHLGTKGCLFDFSRNISEAKQMALQGFICNHCRAALQSHNLENLADDVIPILNKEWFGNSNNPASPAGVVRNLDYDLFRTKGFEATRKEKLLATISQEGIKWPFAVSAAVIGALLAAILLVLFGLQQAGS